MSETLDAVPAETPQVDPADDLRAAIGSAWDEVTNEAEPTPPAEEGANRDERGRFAAQDREANPVVSPETAAEETQPAPLPAPASLSPDDVSRWASLPREHQEWLAAREEKAQQEAQAFQPVKDVLAQYNAYFAARGVPPAQAVVSLFEAERALRENPDMAIEVLARQYGARLPMANAVAQATQPTQPNADYAALVQHVQRLEAEIAQGRQASERAAAEATQQMIRDFAANPEHRHFPTVRTYMGALMTADPGLDMATAYAMACRAHPEVSKAIAAEAAKADQAARTKAANEAKARAVSVRGVPPVANGSGKAPDSLRGTLEAVWDGALH